MFRRVVACRWQRHLLRGGLVSVLGLFRIASVAEPALAASQVEAPGGQKEKSVTPRSDALPTSHQQNSKLPFGGRRWAVGATIGYYAPTTDMFGLKVDPFGPALGITTSYTTPSGIWFGLHGQYFQGKAISQVYEPPLTSLEIEMDAQTQLASVAAQVGFDQVLGPVVLRYALDLGVSFISWDLGDLPYLAIAGYQPMKGSGVGLHVAPGVGLLVPLGGFFVGAELRYRLEMGGLAPSSVGGNLHSGWRF